MSIYQSWGFIDTPFATTALEPNDLGSKLLVGRDAEVDQLTRRIVNAPKMPTLEGPNGIGKTSLVNVTSYRAFQRFMNGDNVPLLVPCRKSFQLAADKNINS